MPYTQHGSYYRISPLSHRRIYDRDTFCEEDEIERGDDSGTGEAAGNPGAGACGNDDLQRNGCDQSVAEQHCDPEETTQVLVRVLRRGIPRPIGEKEGDAMSAFYGLVIWCDDCDCEPFKTRNIHARPGGWSVWVNSGGHERWRCPACTAAQAKIDAFHEAEATKTA